MNSSRIPIGSWAAAFSQWISIVRNGIWIIGILLALLSALVTLVASPLGDPSLRRTFCVIALLVSMAVGVLIGGYVVRAVTYSPGRLFGYVVISQVHDYSFNDGDPRKHTQELTTVVEARYSSVAIIEYRYHWTGEGRRPKVKPVGRGMDVLESPNWIQGEYVVFYVRLHRPVPKGETREIKLRFTMCDRGGVFRPVHAKQVREPIGTLTLIVRFPRACAPEFGQIGGYKSRIGYDRMKRSFPFSWDERSRSASLSVRSPRRNDVYGIEWEWDYPPSKAKVKEGSLMESA